MHLFSLALFYHYQSNPQVVGSRETTTLSDFGTPEIVKVMTPVSYGCVLSLGDPPDGGCSFWFPFKATHKRVPSKRRRAQRGNRLVFSG